MSIFSNERQDRIIKNLRYTLASVQSDLASAIGEKNEFQIEKAELLNDRALLRFKNQMIEEENTALAKDLSTANEKNITLLRKLENVKSDSVTAVKDATTDLNDEIDRLKEELAELRHENAGLNAKLEAQEAMIELAPEVQDIKDVMKQIIEKLPTINITGISQSVNNVK